MARITETRLVSELSSTSRTTTNRSIHDRNIIKDNTNCRLMAYHEPSSASSSTTYLEGLLQQQHQQPERSGCGGDDVSCRDSRAMIRPHTTRPYLVGMRWPETLAANSSVISIILTLLVVSQFTVIFAINAVADGGGKCREIPFKATNYFKFSRTIHSKQKSTHEN